MHEPRLLADEKCCVGEQLAGYGDHGRVKEGTRRASKGSVDQQRELSVPNVWHALTARNFLRCLLDENRESNLEAPGKVSQMQDPSSCVCGHQRVTSELASVCVLQGERGGGTCCDHRDEVRDRARQPSN